MTTTIQVTKEAIEHLAAQSGLYAGDAEELLIELLTMCDISTSSESGAGELVNAAERLLKLRTTVLFLVLPYQQERAVLAGAFHDLAMAVTKVKEGEAAKPSSPEN